MVMTILETSAHLSVDPGPALQADFGACQTAANPGLAPFEDDLGRFIFTLHRADTPRLYEHPQFGRRTQVHAPAS
jgi:hypothetical protein